jgi:predicted metal-dependent hydrolase
VTRRYPSFKAAAECAHCADAPIPEFVHGLEQFNRGEFFEQHETLEVLWIAEKDEVRSLYKGILQIGVGFHHLLHRRNYHGAVTKLASGCRWLQSFQPCCRGVEVSRLIADSQRALLHLQSLGPSRMSDFEPSLIARVHYRRS